ncbi:unnamed protein product [Closterium sp. Yama58-4]|nr:unnamed protein product [Closterium sp. Yama58-4]
MGRSSPVRLSLLPLLLLALSHGGVGVSGSSRPIVIGRRGAMGPMPESTLEGYERAIADGADYVECNVICQHGRLGADLLERPGPDARDAPHSWHGGLGAHLLERPGSHACDERSTPPGAESTQVNGGHRGPGGGGILRLQLHVRADSDPQRAVEQRYQWRDKTLHGRLSIPTLSAVLDLVLSSNLNAELLAARGNRPVGLMLEPRYPEFHESIGCPLLESLLSLLSVNNLQPPPRPSNPFNTLTSSSSPTASLSDRLASISASASTAGAAGTGNAAATAGAATAGGRVMLDPAVHPVVIEARSAAALVYCSQRTSIPLVQILEEGWDEPSDTNPILQAPPPSCPPTTPLRACILDAISLYAVAIAPEKHLVLPVESWHKKLLNQTDLVSLAHDPARQLAVVPWPFANDWIFLSLSYELDPLNEYAMFVEAVGVDGLFSDFPATALKYLRSRDCLAAASGVLGALVVAAPRKRGLADLLILGVIITIAVLPMAIWALYAMHKWRQTEQHLHWQEFATIHSHGPTTASERQPLTSCDSDLSPSSAAAAAAAAAVGAGAGGAGAGAGGDDLSPSGLFSPRIGALHLQHHRPSSPPPLPPGLGGVEDGLALSSAMAGGGRSRGGRRIRAMDFGEEDW